MIGFVCGIKGSGKTQRMVDMANTILRDTMGKIVFVDDDGDRMFDLKPAIRLVNASEYGVTESEAFYGFMAGIVAGDFDIHTIFVDSFLKIVKKPLDELQDLFERLMDMSDKHDVKLILSISAEDSALPAFVAERKLD